MLSHVKLTPVPTGAPIVTMNQPTADGKGKKKFEMTVLTPGTLVVAIVHVLVWLLSIFLAWQLASGHGDDKMSRLTLKANKEDKGLGQELYGYIWTPFWMQLLTPAIILLHSQFVTNLSFMSDIWHTILILFLFGGLAITIVTATVAGFMIIPDKGQSLAVFTWRAPAVHAIVVGHALSNYIQYIAAQDTKSKTSDLTKGLASWSIY